MCSISVQRKLGDALMPCFTGTTAIPCNRINIPRRQPSFVEISTAEVGSIQLEFRDLSRSSNDSKFEVFSRFHPFHAVECRHYVFLRVFS